MKTLSNHESEIKTTRWNLLNVKQKQFIYLGMIIGCLIVVLGITFLSSELNIIVGITTASVGGVILIFVGVMWLWWNHQIQKKNKK